MLVEQDDSSVKFEDTMTLTTANTSLASTLSTKKRRRMVRFSQNCARIVATIPAKDDLSEEERHETWWTPQEYQSIRLGAKFVTKELRLRDKRLVRDIDEAYTSALRLSCKIKDDEFDEFLHDPSQHIKCLELWCARKISGRGLERYTSAKHRYERAEFAGEARGAVLRLTKNPTIAADQVAAFYREYARSAYIFARLVGAADEVIAKEVYATDQVSALLSQIGASGNVLPISPKTRNRRDLMTVAKQPSRSQLLVKQLSQRIEHAV